MVEIHITKRSFSRTYDRFSKFILIGNKIDGYVSFRFQEFKNYEEAMREMPKIFQAIECAGEWNLEFYQVPNDYKLHKRWGYYAVPNKGKLVFSYSYMDVGEVIEMTMNHSMIHIASISRDKREVWNDWDSEVDSEAEFDDFDIYESYITIHLKGKESITLTNADFNGWLHEYFE